MATSTSTQSKAHYASGEEKANDVMIVNATSATSSTWTTSSSCTNNNCIHRANDANMKIIEFNNLGVDEYEKFGNMANAWYLFKGALELQKCIETHNKRNSSSSGSSSSDDDEEETLLSQAIATNQYIQRANRILTKNYQEHKQELNDIYDDTISTATVASSDTATSTSTNRSPSPSSPSTTTNEQATGRAKKKKDDTESFIYFRPYIHSHPFRIPLPDDDEPSDCIIRDDEEDEEHSNDRTNVERVSLRVAIIIFNIAMVENVVNKFSYQPIKMYELALAVLPLKYPEDYTNSNTNEHDIYCIMLGIALLNNIGAWYYHTNQRIDYAQKRMEQISKLMTILSSLQTKKRDSTDTLLPLTGDDHVASTVAMITSTVEEEEVRNHTTQTATNKRNHLLLQLFSEQHQHAVLQNITWILLSPPGLPSAAA